MTKITDEELLEIFWEESYPGWGGDYSLEPREVYTDHLEGIKAVRKALENEREPWGKEWLDARDANDWDGDTLEAAVADLVMAIEQSRAPEQVIAKNGRTHRRLRHALIALRED